MNYIFYFAGKGNYLAFFVSASKMYYLIWSIVLYRPLLFLGTYPYFYYSFSSPLFADLWNFFKANSSLGRYVLLLSSKILKDLEVSSCRLKSITYHYYIVPSKFLIFPLLFSLKICIRLSNYFRLHMLLLS